MQGTCSFCHHPFSSPVVLTRSTGRGAVSWRLWNRIGPRPRPLSGIRAAVPNITREQFLSWRRPSWRLIRSVETPRGILLEYMLEREEDIEEMCCLEVAARCSRDPSQGYRNMRASERGEVGVIVKPMVLSFR